MTSQIGIWWFGYGETQARNSQGLSVPVISEGKLDQVKEEMLAPLKREAGFGPAWVTQTLQGIMIPNFVLYIKKESMLKAALAYVEELRDHHMQLEKQPFDRWSARA